MKFLITLFIKRERSVRNMIYLYSLRSGVNISIPPVHFPSLAIGVNLTSAHPSNYLSIYPRTIYLSFYLP